MTRATRISIALAWMVIGCGDGKSAGSGGAAGETSETDDDDGNEPNPNPASYNEPCGFDHWSYAAPLLANRNWEYASVRLHDGTVLVTGGGFYPDEETFQSLSSGERYDPATDVWSPIADMPVSRISHAQVVLEDGTVLSIAGNVGTMAVPNDGVYRYDPTLDQWSAAPSLPIEITGAEAVLAPDNGVFLASRSAFLRSEDGGASWSVVAQPPYGYHLDGGMFRWGDDTFVIPRAVPTVPEDHLQPVQLYRWSTDSWEQVPPAYSYYVNGYAPLSATRMLLIMTTPGVHGEIGQTGVSFEFDMGGESWTSFVEADFYGDTTRVMMLPYQPGWLWAGKGAYRGHVYEDATDRWCRTETSTEMPYRSQGTILVDGRILFTGGEVDVDGETRTLAQIWSHS